MKLHKWRRRQVNKMKLNDPARTATSIAQELGISISRVAEIFKQDGLYESPWTSFTCNYCGEEKPILRSALSQKKLRGNQNLYCDREHYDRDRNAYPYLSKGT